MPGSQRLRLLPDCGRIEELPYENGVRKRGQVQFLSRGVDDVPALSVAASIARTTRCPAAK